MPTIIFAPTTQLTQVEDFPADCDRTVKGALHVRPGATCVVNDAEAEHLKKRGIAFTVSASTKAAPLPAPVPSAGPAEPVVAVPSPSLDSSESAPQKGAAGKGAPSKAPSKGASSDEK